MIKFTSDTKGTLKEEGTTKEQVILQLIEYLTPGRKKKASTDLSAKGDYK